MTTIVKWDPNIVDNFIVSLNHQDIVQFNSFTDGGKHWIKFYSDGYIETHGDVHKAAEYIISQCWNVFLNPSGYSIDDKNNLVITIHDYFKINLGSKTITHAKEKYSQGFYQLKEVLERHFIRKIKLIAFW